MHLQQLSFHRKWQVFEWCGQRQVWEGVMCAAGCLLQWVLFSYLLCSEGSCFWVLPFPWFLLGKSGTHCFWYKNNWTELEVVFHWTRSWIHSIRSHLTLRDSVHCTTWTMNYKQVWFTDSERGRPEGTLEIIQYRSFRVSMAWLIRKEQGNGAQPLQ